MKNIIAVVNQKGGVGKTTTSINLSSGLALKGKKVLLIDLDPQAHSTVGLGIEQGSYSGAVHEVLFKKRKAAEIIIQTEFPNLSLMPSCIRLDKAEQQLTGEIFREAILSKAINKLNNYDFVIIDCRPTLGTLTVNALYASDFLIVPCEMSRYSLEGFADLMDTIAQVRNTHNKQLIRILLTKFDSRNKVSNDWVLEQLVDFEDIIFKTLIRKNEALNQAHMHQEPIFSFKPDSYGAEDYKKLTKEVLILCRQQEKN